VARRTDLHHHLGLAEPDHPGRPLSGHDRPRARHLVDRDVPRVVHGDQAGASVTDEQRLLLGAVVRRRVREHDVAHTEAPEPCPVGRARQVVVEHLVLREVVLPEPAACERNPGARQVNGRPVARGVDGLDPVRRRQVLVEVARGGLPVGGARGLVLARAARERPGMRAEVPHRRQDEHERRHR
jgi:hypothetical protein